MNRRFSYWPLAFLALITAGCDTATSENATPARAEAVFAGGCFWCTEADFDKMPGVLETTSGYIGGRSSTPDYAEVSAGSSGHLEAVRVAYDSRKVSYATLVSRFLRTVDPTDAGGQFCDRGDQYRSAIFVASSREQDAARSAIALASVKLRSKVKTQIRASSTFYPAEAYHQDFHRRNPVRYRFYRVTCGRDARLKEIWAQ